MKLIVGLGNPGTAYEHTRHNIGFRVVDAINDALQQNPWRTQKKFRAQLCDATLADSTRILLVKPDTYMNASGTSIAALRRFYEIAVEDIFVVQDDVDVSFGKLRFRHHGSAGGHKGISSMEQELGENAFRRFRFGIGPKRPERMPLEDFVLQKFTAVEEAALRTALHNAAAYCIQVIERNSTEATVHLLDTKTPG